MDVSKAKIKYIRSLQSKKNRDEQNVFIAEGSKLVKELIPYFGLKYMFCTEQWHMDHIDLISGLKSEEIVVVEDADKLKMITQLSTPSVVICVFYKKESEDIEQLVLYGDIVLALDGIQDPGNLGTIIRTADWFGVKHIFCSNDTVDLYNSKVVSSTMGAIARVNVQYGDLVSYLRNCQLLGQRIYGTFLEGEVIYRSELKSEKAVLIMGNEGKGISEKVKEFVAVKLNIPNYPEDIVSSESLNVAIATSIVLSEFRRR